MNSRTQASGETTDCDDAQPRDDEKADPCFVALDLEYNQPSRTIIQVGVALGRASQSDRSFVVRKWTIAVAENIDPFITGLTGIRDLDVAESGVPLDQCAAELSALLKEHRAFVNPVTWGGGDSEDLLSAFAERGIAFPHFGRRWIDVKTWVTLLSFANPAGIKSSSGGLRSMMGRYRLHFLGIPHRADVDAFNTLRLFFRILERQRALEGAAGLIKSGVNDV